MPDKNFKIRTGEDEWPFSVKVGNDQFCRTHSLERLVADAVVSNHGFELQITQTLDLKTRILIAGLQLSSVIRQLHTATKVAPLLLASLKYIVIYVLYVLFNQRINT